MIFGLRNRSICTREVIEHLKFLKRYFQNKNAFTLLSNIIISYLILNINFYNNSIRFLNKDGVNTRHVIRAKDKPSPFTYVIVDLEGIVSLEKQK